MKFLCLIMAFPLLSFHADCQTTYHNPNLHCIYILDSLKIPYIPMKLRVKNEGFSESDRQKFIDFFGADLPYLPNKEGLNTPFDLFILNKKFASDRDDFFNVFMANFECKVSASSIIPIHHKLYKSIWLLEVYAPLNDSFCVVLYYQDIYGIFHTIFSDTVNTPESWVMPAIFHE